MSVELTEKKGENREDIKNKTANLNRELGNGFKLLPPAGAAVR
jgi:hypothetical protein